MLASVALVSLLQSTLEYLYRKEHHHSVLIVLKATHAIILRVPGKSLDQAPSLHALLSQLRQHGGNFKRPNQVYLMEYLDHHHSRKFAQVGFVIFH